MRPAFDHLTDMDHHGSVMGGTGKPSCVRNGWIASVTVYDLVETPCCDIIEELRTLFRDLYCHVPLDASVSTRAQLSIAAKRERDPQVKDARKKLSFSQWILDMMNRHLASKWDVGDERNRRKRKAPNDRDGGCRLTYNALRKGRLLPSVSMSSGDVLALMGHRGGTNFTTCLSRALHASAESLPSRVSKSHSGRSLA